MALLVVALKSVMGSVPSTTTSPLARENEATSTLIPTGMGTYRRGSRFCPRADAGAMVSRMVTIAGAAAPAVSSVRTGRGGRHGRRLRPVRGRGQVSLLIFLLQALTAPPVNWKVLRGQAC